MDLKALKQEIPYQWRVQSFSKFKPEASCVAYIDARDVMELLDEVCGPENWQSDYKSVDGQMFAGIGIRGEVEREIWIWKWDTGSESNIEKEKGQASDSFKRAAVKWGIGRFLYELPTKKLTANEVQGASNKPYVVDGNGARVWDLSKHINGMGDKVVKVSAEGGHTYSTMAKVVVPKVAAPVWKQPIKSADKSLKEKKAAIADLLNAHPTVLSPLKDKEDYAEACERITGLELNDDNTDLILKSLLA